MLSNKHFSFLLYLPFIILVLQLSSCNDELFTSDVSKNLSFSTDTLTFDTIFTSIGSTTERFLIYNKNNRALKISSIKLAGGANSQFRINVDGAMNANNEFTDIEISANDSMFVFVEVTVNPNAENTPVLIADSVIFNTNTVRQKVRLEAFGQDVYFIKDQLFLNDTTLKSDKPYLIYGYMAIDTAKTLTIPPGCRLYFHNNANLLLYGNLVAEGSFEKPIVMRGDRFDLVKFLDPAPYEYVAGQWGGVYLMSNKANYSFRNVNISSAYVGLYCDNNDRAQLPNIYVLNCKIHNFVYYGVVAHNANLTVANSEISNTGSFSVYLNGGKHVFLQSTIANYYSSNAYEPSSRDKNPAVMIMALNRSAAMETEFKNCIIAGGLENEFSIASRFVAQYKAVFANSFIRRKVAFEFSQFQNIVWYEKGDSTLFKHAKYDYLKNKYFDFTPDSLSRARGLADINVANQFPIDLNGNSRLQDSAPDAGAYEWKSIK